MKKLQNSLMIVSSLFVLMACGSEFQPRTSLQEVRVLAVEASPLEVGLAESVTINPVIYVPDERSVVSYRWHYCPINFGAAAGYACIDPDCDVDVASDALVASISITPSDALFACLGILATKAEADDSGETDSTGGMDPDAINKVDTALFLEMTDDEGRVFRHVKAIPLWKEKPEVINQAPVVSDVIIDGVSVLDGSPARRSEKQILKSEWLSIRRAWALTSTALKRSWMRKPSFRFTRRQADLMQTGKTVSMLPTPELQRR